ncbi:CBO0543 family protein [Pelotomaculum propionicicum]|uniref:CBO0543 family protein n=1 Tax=Pelotomaculum propionicicum TaxID=258475 RepID=UPI003B769D6B
MDFNILKLAEINLIAAFPFLAAAWKWGDWRNWRRYYPTVLFFIAIDFAYGYITKNQPLWQFESLVITSTFSFIFVALVGQPPAIFLFLSLYPNKLHKQIGYILIWVAIFSIIEIIAFKIGSISYQNGWNIWFSILFNCIMFTIIRLHYKEPLQAWIITIVLAVIIMFLFNISL